MNKEITPNFIHSLDAAIINSINKKIRHYCKECGKDDGHYIGCKESHN